MVYGSGGSGVPRRLSEVHGWRCRTSNGVFAVASRRGSGSAPRLGRGEPPDQHHAQDRPLESGHARPRAEYGETWDRAHSSETRTREVTRLPVTNHGAGGNASIDAFASSRHQRSGGWRGSRVVFRHGFVDKGTRSVSNGGPRGRVGARTLISDLMWKIPDHHDAMQSFPTVVPESLCRTGRYVPADRRFAPGAVGRGRLARSWPMSAPSARRSATCCRRRWTCRPATGVGFTCSGWIGVPGR